MRPSKLRLPTAPRRPRGRASLTAAEISSRQRAGVADAGRAAVADEVEAERVEGLGRARRARVLGDDLRARRQRRLDPRLALEAALRRRCGRASPAASITDGFEVFVQRVIAAITTWPWSSSNVLAVQRDRRPRCASARRPRRRPVIAGAGASTGASWPGTVSAGGSQAGKRLGHAPRRALSCLVGTRRRSRSSSAVAERAPWPRVSDDAVLRALGPGDRRHDRRRGRARRVGERRLLGVLVVPEALLLGVGLDERRSAPSGGPRTRGSAASRRRSGRSRRSSRTRGSCCRSSRGRPAAARETPGPKNSTNLPTTPFSRSISVTVSTRSVAVAPSGSSPVQLEADDLRDQHRHRLAEHRRLGLDAADAPAEHAEAVDHRRVRVGADERVGVGRRRSCR